MDEFSDDDFDDLNANALQELENSAIQFTQAQKRPFELSQEQLELEFEDDDAVVHDNLRGKPVESLPQPEALKPAVPPSRIVQPAPATRQNGWGPVPIPASHFRPQPIGSAARPPGQLPHSSRPSQTYNSQIRPPPPLPRPAPKLYPSQAPQRQPETSTRDQAALLAQIQELQSRLSTREGEIQIVRSRLEQDRQKHDHEVQALKKQTAEQLAKQELLVEAAKSAEENTATELKFTRRDLKDELERTKLKEKDGGTPKKAPGAKSWDLADGFEDVEIAGSPNRRNRNKNAGGVASVVAEPPARLTRTPTKGKRKRPAMDSPVMALDTTEDVVMADEVEPTEVKEIYTIATTPRPFSFDFLKVILNHSAGHGRPLAFDFLAGFALPSRPSESLASILFSKLGAIGDPSDVMRLPIDFCLEVIRLWENCLKEDCLEPISELVSLVSFTLQLHTVAIAPYIAQPLLDVGQLTAYEVTVLRLNNPDLIGISDPKAQNFATHVNTTEILSLLYLTALGCATSPLISGAVTSPIFEFWNTFYPQLVLILLESKQLLPDVLAMLKLLRTSIFDDMIGPVAHAEKTAEEIIPHIIQRISLHLVETMRWELDVTGLRAFRIEVLRTLTSFARSPFGMQQLKANHVAVPRLVVFLCDCIDELYDGETAREFVFAPGSPNDDSCRDADGKSRHQPAVDHLQTLISHTMLLLHTIVMDKASEINLSTKLAKFVGGTQKYLLSLARLNFADSEEGLLGVSEETAELAHELLELAVTEDDGAELGIFFGG